MANNSKIEWTQATWNPITGCDKVSQGCKNCYAEIMHRRLMKMHPRKYNKPFLGYIETHEDDLSIPMKRKAPTIYFVNSMSDLWHPDVPFDFILSIFLVMKSTPHHTYQILTKRPEQAVRFFEFLKNSPVKTKFHRLPNVWIGISVEDQKAAAERIPYLLQIPAAIRFLSCEPLLGPIDLTHIDADGAGHKDYCQINCLTGEQTDMARPCRDVESIDWVIVGGESGHKARPMHPDWVRLIRDQCKRANIPFFFKQWGSWAPPPDEWPEKAKRQSVVHNGIGYEMINLGKHAAGNLLDGQTYLNYP
jgi:protein gp37